MKKILHNLRLWLIHKLGGIAASEAYKLSCRSYNDGKFVAHSTDRQYADTLYGLPADEWSQKMYDRLKNNEETARQQCKHE